MEVTAQIQNYRSRPVILADRGISFDPMRHRKSGDLSRRAIESFELEELKAGRITEPEFGLILGLARLLTRAVW